MKLKKLWQKSGVRMGYCHNRNSKTGLKNSVVFGLTNHA
jgi:hypothetical protein